MSGSDYLCGIQSRTNKMVCAWSVPKNVCKETFCCFCGGTIPAINQPGIVVCSQDLAAIFFGFLHPTLKDTNTSIGPVNPWWRLVTYVLFWGGVKFSPPFKISISLFWCFWRMQNMILIDVSLQLAIIAASKFLGVDMYCCLSKSPLNLWCYWFFWLLMALWYLIQTAKNLFTCFFYGD